MVICQTLPSVYGEVALADIVVVVVELVVAVALLALAKGLLVCARQSPLPATRTAATVISLWTVFILIIFLLSFSAAYAGNFATRRGR